MNPYQRTRQSIALSSPPSIVEGNPEKTIRKNVRLNQVRCQSARTLISDRQHFDQWNCLEKSIGDPPSISMVELSAVPHKVEADLDA
jgi:hypothetical protein